MTTSNAAKNAAADAPQSSKARKGANGILLKKFEAVMCDLFSPATTAASSKREEGGPPASHSLIPRYCQLPPCATDDGRQALVRRAQRYWHSRELAPSAAATESSPWPFDSRTSLPQCGCVRGNARNKPRTSKSRKDKGVGDVLNNDRATRKELQLANLIQCVLALLPDEVRNGIIKGGDRKNFPSKSFRIVDFAGGTGHLAVPLALLLPACEVVCVDLKKWSLDLLHRRVDGSDETHNTNTDEKSSHKPQIQTSNTLPNLSTYHGSIQTYPETFDLGVSLHACGEASDWVLRKCVQARASWIVCSCCCGKLRTAAANPYVYQSTGGNAKGIAYPQSAAFAASGRGHRPRTRESEGGSREPPAVTAERFDEIARAADYGELGDVRKPRNACRRAAKSLVEWDRLLFAKECMTCTDDCAGDADTSPPSKNVILTRMVPWEASPKNDILIGWFHEAHNPYRSEPFPTARPPEDATCDADFQVALHHLFGKTAIDASRASTNDATEVHGTEDDRNDWTAQEEAGITSQIEVFLAALPAGDSNTLRFPRGMGPRKRKLIHYVAENMGLRHWGEGKKDSEKIVAVAGRRREHVSEPPEEASQGLQSLSRNVCNLQLEL